MSETLLKMDSVKKVFLTDEVETHALSGIHLEINQGEYVSIREEEHLRTFKVARVVEV